MINFEQVPFPFNCLYSVIIHCSIVSSCDGICLKMRRFIYVGLCTKQFSFQDLTYFYQTFPSNFRSSYLFALFSHVKVSMRNTFFQINQATHDQAVVLQNALQNIPNPTSECMLRNVAIRLAQQISDEVGEFLSCITFFLIASFLFS